VQCCGHSGTSAAGGGVAHEHAPRHVVSKLPYRPAVRDLGSTGASGAPASLRTSTCRDLGAVMSRLSALMDRDWKLQLQ